MEEKRFNAKNIQPNRLKQIRIDRGLTLQNVADGTGLKNPTIANYENMKREPSTEQWALLASFFKEPVPYLQGKLMDDAEYGLLKASFNNAEKYKHLLDSYNELFPEKGFFRFRALDDDEEFYKKGNLWLDKVQGLEDTAVALDVDPTDIPAIRFRLANDILAPSLPKWTIASPSFKVKVWARLNAITDEQREKICAELFPNNTAK